MTSRCDVDIDAVLRRHERQAEILMRRTSSHDAAGEIPYINAFLGRFFLLTRRPVAVAVGRERIVGAECRRLNIDPGEWLAWNQRLGMTDHVDMQKTNQMAGMYAISS